MKSLLIPSILMVLLAVPLPDAAMGASAPPPLPTVHHVDLARYVGTWYEIARYPNRFQKGCVGSTALYTLRNDGDIEVINSCTDKDSGRIRQVKGRARVVDRVTNAKLEVSFFWPFRGDYWIVDLGPAYEYAVVGTPNRKYLWILSRTPTMEDTLYSSIMERVRQLGFDPGKVLREPDSFPSRGGP